MKKDFIQDILLNLIVRRKKSLEDKKTMKKNYESLSIVDRNAYEQIINRKDNSHFYILTAPFYTVFYLGIFGLVLKYAFNIEVLLLAFKPMVLIIFGWFKYFLLAWLFFLLINLIELNNTRREILLKR